MDDDSRDMSSDNTDSLNVNTRTKTRKRKYSSKEEVREHKKLSKRKQRKDANPEQDSRERERRKKRSWRKQDYVDLLNELKDDARARTYLASASMDSKFRSEDVQDGITVWSPKDRHAFAEELARNNVRDIGSLKAALRSKSSFEILAFRHTMIEASAKHDLHGRPLDLLRPEEIPAASEISLDCCKALEKAADHICKLEWKGDCGHEKIRYGEHYLLTIGIAQHFEDRLTGNGSDTGVGTVAPQQDGLDILLGTLNADVIKAMNLLDLGMLLHLSENFYTVTGRQERSSKRDRPDDQEHPSIFASALIDFQDLVHSVTRRLIGSSIFQANTRLRANDYRNSKPSKLRIRSQDVIAAVDMLRMPRNSLDYWQDAPRRLDLNIYRTVRNDKGRRNHVLITNKFTELSRQKRRSRSTKDQSEDSGSERDEKQGSPTSEIVTQEEEAVEMEESEDDVISSDELDHYMTKYDRKASAEEEQRLWKLMREPCPPDGADTLEGELSPAPRGVRKSSDDIVDWRSRCDYKSPWERYGRAYIDQVLPALDVNGGRFRRTNSRRQSSASDISGLTSGDSFNEDIESDEEREEGAGDTIDDRTASRDDQAISARGAEATSDKEDSSISTPTSARGRSRRRSSSVVNYVFETADGVPHPEDMPSDSGDDFQPTGYI